MGTRKQALKQAKALKTKEAKARKRDEASHAHYREYLRQELIERMRTGPPTRPCHTAPPAPDRDTCVPRFAPAALTAVMSEFIHEIGILHRRGSGACLEFGGENRTRQL